MNDTHINTVLTADTIDEPQRTNIKKSKKDKLFINPRSASRLVAIQALYAMDITHKRPSEVIEELRQFACYPVVSQTDKQHDIIIPDNYDIDYSTSILYGVVREQRAIDPLISDFLPDTWHFNRLDKVMCAILRAAIYELLFSPAIPPKVTINEYTNIASSFHLNDGNSLVNGILNAIARGNNLIES
jgi:N utilization substance protein B